MGNNKRTIWDYVLGLAVALIVGAALFLIYNQVHQIRQQQIKNTQQIQQNKSEINNLKKPCQSDDVANPAKDPGCTDQKGSDTEPSSDNIYTPSNIGEPGTAATNYQTITPAQTATHPTSAPVQSQSNPQPTTANPQPQPSVLDRIQQSIGNLL